MGELTIWELRDQAQRALGAGFDVRDFHDAVLTSGGLPLELLREQIGRYIVRSREEQSGNPEAAGADREE